MEKRSWPLDVRRTVTLPPRPGGKALLVRTLRAAPGLEARGLQIVQNDGSIRTDFYEEWSVPPADAVEDVLRRWLAASGLFSAVLAPGSRARADLALEGELQSLLAMPAQGSSVAALGLVLDRPATRAGPCSTPDRGNRGGTAEWNVAAGDSERGPGRRRPPDGAGRGEVGGEPASRLIVDIVPEDRSCQ